MVAICTGPAFSTDDAGNLILAGERRKQSTSPCALKDGNGLYTDPRGGVYAVDQVYMQQYNNNTVSPGTQINSPAIIPYAYFTQSYSNGTCWPVMLNVECSYRIWARINTNSVLWWAIGAGLDNPNPGFTTIQSEWYSQISPWVSTEWMATHTQIVEQFVIQPHSSHNVTVASRMEARVGSGVMVQATYSLHAFGYAVNG